MMRIMAVTPAYMDASGLWVSLQSVSQSPKPMHSQTWSRFPGTYSGRTSVRMYQPFLAS